MKEEVVGRIGAKMKHKSIAFASITVLLCMVLGNIIACAPAPTIEYALVINSTEGGSVTTPGEDTFTYDKGTVVNLVAEAEEGYYFVNWTGDVDTITNVNAASTTITMNGDYSITANFEVPGVLFSDDFSDENSGWVTYDDYDGRVIYHDGCLYVKDYTAYEWATHSKSQRYFTDFILEVETWLVDGTDDNWHMVGCRVSGELDYYHFGISADGYYEIVKWVGEDRVPLTGPTPIYSTYIKQGQDVINLIHIECIGSSLSLSVNGHELASVTDDTFSSGDIALIASALAGAFTEVAFDNIVVTEP